MGKGLEDREMAKDLGTGAGQAAGTWWGSAVSGVLECQQATDDGCDFGGIW
jgi:hypothetical protein